MNAFIMVKPELLPDVDHVFMIENGLVAEKAIGQLLRLIGCKEMNMIDIGTFQQQ